MSKWTQEIVRDTLRNNGIEIVDEARLNNDLGWRLIGASGEMVCVYDSGKLAIQGKRQPEMKALFGQSAPATVTAVAAVPVGGVVAIAKAATNRNVFVVYGHDGTARTELEAMLRRWGLNPLILDQLTSGGQTIIEKLEHVRKDAGFAVVLATPDDQGHRAGHADEVAYRARQNVVLELGMMLSVLGRDRVAVLLKDQVSMERPSDIQGLIYIPFKDDVRETALTLAKEISAKGIFIDLQKV